MLGFDIGFCPKKTHKEIIDGEEITMIDDFELLDVSITNILDPRKRCKVIDMARKETEITLKDLRKAVALIKETEVDCDICNKLKAGTHYRLCMQHGLIVVSPEVLDIVKRW